MPDELTAEEFKVGEPLLMIYVGETLGEDLSHARPDKVYECVKEWWKLQDPRRRDPPIKLVLARNSDRVVGAFRPERWYSWHPMYGGHLPRRWGFVGKQAEMSIQLTYVGKEVPAKFKRSKNPVRYLKPGE